LRYVLGVDGGGSKVACLAADEGGRLLGYGCDGPVHTSYVPPDEAMDSLKNAIDAALKEAGLRGEQIEALCMSAPMIPDAVDIVMGECGIKHAIRAAEGETPRWAARFWVDEHVGVTVDGGTGSLARGWARDGREVGVGGWGPTLGDEGSGYWISMRSMIAVLQAHDGRIQETMLTSSVLEHFQLSTVNELGYLVRGRFGKVRTHIGLQPDSGYMFNQSAAAKESKSPRRKMSPPGGLLFSRVAHMEPLKRHEVASFCPSVEKVARQGDWKALEILQDAGHELGRLAVAVIKRLGMEKDEFVVVPFGGVFKAGNLVLDTFKEIIDAAVPQARVVKPEFEPVVGAVLLALNNIGVVIDDRVIDTLEQSSGSFPFCRSN